MSDTVNQKIEQTIDIKRPHTLLTEDVKKSGSLVYRYDDTGETISVPNIWYNQTYQQRVAAVRWEAHIIETKAFNFEKKPPFMMSPSDVSLTANRYRNMAKKIRSEADRIELHGNPAYPVAASRIQLDYGQIA